MSLDSALTKLSEHLGVRLVVTGSPSPDIDIPETTYLGGRCGEKFETGSSFYVKLSGGQIVEVGGSMSGKKFKFPQEIK